MITFAPLSVAHRTPSTTAASSAVPSAPRTCTESRLTPAYAVPAMPTALFVVAAAMPASCVPWPCGSVFGSPPVKLTPPMTRPARSGCAALMPVSRTAMVALPVIGMTPFASSKPILGSAHCCP